MLTIRVVWDDAVGPNKARKSTCVPHSEQQQSALPDRFDGAQGQQRGVAIAGSGTQRGFAVAVWTTVSVLQIRSRYKQV